MKPATRLTHDGYAGCYEGVTSTYDLERRLEVLVDDFLARGRRQPNPDSGRRTPDVVLALDAGCGTGVSSDRLRRAGLSVISMDIGPNMARTGRERFGTTPIVGDIARCPFADGTFDVVFSSEVIEHTADPLGAFSELYRVLKPGGRLSLSTPNKAWQGIVRMATRVGFRPDFGEERFIWPRALAAHARRLGATIVRHEGVHLLPFQVRRLQPLLRKFDRYGAALLPLMINQCILVEKPCTRADHE